MMGSSSAHPPANASMMQTQRRVSNSNLSIPNANAGANAGANASANTGASSNTNTITGSGSSNVHNNVTGNLANHRSTSTGTVGLNNANPYHHSGGGRTSYSYQTAGRNSSFIRKGPLYFSFIILLLIPCLVVTFLSTNLEKQMKRLDRMQQKAGEQKQQQASLNQVISSTLNADDDTSTLYHGPSWLQMDQIVNPSLITVAETESAICQRIVNPQQSYFAYFSEDVLAPDALILQEMDVIQVVILDTRQRIWVTTTSDAKLSTIPEAHRRWRPVSGQMTSQDHKQARSVFAVAQQLVHIAVGIPIPDNNDTPQPRTVDEYGLLDGSSTASQWTYLGRHRTMPDRGGAFVHSYLLKGVTGLPSDYTGTQQVEVLTRDETKQALLQGKFGDARSVATVSLALLS